VGLVDSLPVELGGDAVDEGGDGDVGVGRQGSVGAKTAWRASR
jgi:hypothetical protein